MATTNQVIQDFMYGSTKGKASSVRIEGDKLMNYNTVIAQRINEAVVINKTKYSPTTSKHQNVLLRSMPNAQTVEGVDQNAYDLIKYLK